MILTIQINGQQGIDDFARMLLLLANNGFHGQAKRLIALLIVEAEKKGVTVPPEVGALVTTLGMIPKSPLEPR